MRTWCFIRKGVKENLNEELENDRVADALPFPGLLECDEHQRSKRQSGGGEDSRADAC